jgi:hypothetical protein
VLALDKRTGTLIASSFYNVFSMQQRTLKLQGREQFQDYCFNAIV